MTTLTKDDRDEVVQAWYMDDNDEDQRLPRHRNPKQFVSLKKLEELGVLTWRLDAENYEADEELKKIRGDRGYSNMEVYDICPQKISNYDEMINSLYKEHFHTAEEVSFCLFGSGYYDMRDCDDAWIRIWVKKGAMIALPAGIYHRFSTDSNNHIKIMALHAGEPINTAYNHSDDHLPERKQYVDTFAKKTNCYAPMNEY